MYIQCIIKLCKAILHGTLSCSSSGISYQGCLNSEQPWMTEIVYLFEAKGRLLTAYHEGFGIAECRFLTHNVVYCVWLLVVPLPCVKQDSGNQFKKMMILCLLLPGTAGPKVSCHLPASVKLWQVNL